VPLPVAFAPLGNAYEHVSDGRFGFDVDIRHRWLGRIVRYRGWLVPETAGWTGQKREESPPVLAELAHAAPAKPVISSS
jgi:hypothetical protein